MFSCYYFITIPSRKEKEAQHGSRQLSAATLGFLDNFLTAFL
jgi:hypothetical protein